MKFFQYDIECLSREQLQELQLKRLKEQVEYVFQNVLPYREKMINAGIKPGDIQKLSDIEYLPFTEKTDLRDNYPFGLMAVSRDKLQRLHASSGTTGKLTVVGYTKEDLEIWNDVMARSIVAAGGSSSSMLHVAYGYGLFTGGLGAHGGAERLGACVVPASSGNTARQAMLIKDFEADILCCTPSYALCIAEEFERQKFAPEDIPLKSGIFGAEPWTNEMRVDIEKRLGIDAYDIYGLSEIIGPGVSMECSQKNGMHIYEDHFMPEVLAPETLKPVSDGGRGELVITTLTKKGMPLLRYRTRDLCTITYKPCGCGRTHARMSKVLGRTDDMLIIRGVNVFPSQIESVLLSAGEAVAPHYQIVVDRINNADSLEIQIELKEAFDTISKIQKIKSEVEKQLYNVLGLNSAVKLLEPNSIPRSEGKAKRIIDKRKLN